MNFADCGDNIFYTDMSPTKARIMLVLLLDNKSDSGTFEKCFYQEESLMDSIKAQDIIRHNF